MSTTTKKCSFGARTSLVETGNFTITISTAKAGLFKGLSTIILHGVYLDASPIIKLIYKSFCPRRKRYEFHDSLARQFEIYGRTLDFEAALELIRYYIIGSNIIKIAYICSKENWVPFYPF